MTLIGGGPKAKLLFAGGVAAGTTVVGELNVVLQEVQPLFVQLVPIQQFFVNILGETVVDIEHCIGEDFIRDVNITDAPGSAGSAVDITGFTFFFSAFDVLGGDGLIYPTRTGVGEFIILGDPLNGIARLTITNGLTTLLKFSSERYRFDMWGVNAALERFPLAKGLYKLTQRYTAEVSFP